VLRDQLREREEHDKKLMEEKEKEKQAAIGGKGLADLRRAAILDRKRKQEVQIWLRYR
jgi:hypothetical protein